MSLCNEQFLSLRGLACILILEKSANQKCLCELVDEKKLKLRYSNMPSQKDQEYKINFPNNQIPYLFREVECRFIAWKVVVSKYTLEMRGSV